MKRIEVFDPAMCCPTGVCGPSVDPELTRVANQLFILEKLGYAVQRFNLASEPDAFVQNAKIAELLHEKGPDVLPVTVVEGEVMKAGEYPSTQEFAEWLGINEKALTMAHPKKAIEFKTL